MRELEDDEVDVSLHALSGGGKRESLLVRESSSAMASAGVG